MLRCHAQMPFNTTRTTCDLDSDDVANKERARSDFKAERDGGAVAHLSQVLLVAQLPYLRSPAHCGNPKIVEIRGRIQG